MVVQPWVEKWAQGLSAIFGKCGVSVTVVTGLVMGLVLVLLGEVCSYPLMRLVLVSLPGEVVVRVLTMPRCYCCWRAGVLWVGWRVGWFVGWCWFVGPLVGSSDR